MTGNTNVLPLLIKVVLDIICKFMHLAKFEMPEKVNPLKYVAADSIILPMGCFPTNGCDFQVNLWLFMQYNSTDNPVPLT